MGGTVPGRGREREPGEAQHPQTATEIYGWRVRPTEDVVPGPPDVNWEARLNVILAFCTSELDDFRLIVIHPIERIF